VESVYSSILELEWRTLAVYILAGFYAMKKQKPKKCKYSKCKKEFMPWSTTQATCDNYLCALGYGAEKKAKKEKKEHAKGKKAFRLSDKPLQKKLTQALINKAAKLWDLKAGRGCISCGKKGGATYGGHYLSVGSNPAMRFNFKNIHLQCFSCNGPLSSNAINYRLGLVERYGEKFVDDLESDKEPRQFSNDEVILIGKYYKGMIKEMESS
jgi:hypothetical protein